MPCDVVSWVSRSRLSDLRVMMPESESPISEEILGDEFESARLARVFERVPA